MVLYWAKVLTDHPKSCDNCFVVQYFGMNFITLNENTIWYKSYASPGIWHSACSLCMCIHRKPLKRKCNLSNDLNLNSVFVVVVVVVVVVVFFVVFFVCLFVCCCFFFVCVFF